MMFLYYGDIFFLKDVYFSKSIHSSFSYLLFVSQIIRKRDAEVARLSKQLKESESKVVQLTALLHSVARAQKGNPQSQSAQTLQPTHTTPVAPPSANCFNFIPQQQVMFLPTTQASYLPLNSPCNFIVLKPNNQAMPQNQCFYNLAVSGNHNSNTPTNSENK
ncbi:hypothetical protein [Rhinolophus gammaherpesvirus 1]|uniref:Uncharacterized protein n=1 Tax=Rhinolophus gammaherpesvirus 1 TaxID=2054179 RepID=A0A2Z5U7D8_9GAMA|nr:hypothetical protein [Rhinolophus gammaherpesvirus 1]BBB06500.1 hypothetical protein [Rhinolophus gammaherpesvirus 1]